MNLFEKLNRLDDKLVESKRVVDTKRLTESFEHDDDVDEILTESEEKYELSTLVKDSINHLVNDLGKDSMADDFGDDVCADIEANYDIDVPENPVKYADWCDAVMSEVSRQLNNKEELTENRNNPYFTPYGYRDAAKVLNGKAPEYYYHLKEIEMDRGDGVKLARYAMRKGLPVMVDKNSDPDYPEFAIKGEYHWNDYFYPYPTAHEEDLVAWDGKMFVEEQLTESIKVEPIVDKIVNVIERNGFTNRSVSSTDSTITMEDKDGDKTTYAIKVKMVPHFILEEELANVQIDTTDKNQFIKEAAFKILNK